MHCAVQSLDLPVDLERTPLNASEVASSSRGMPHWPPRTDQFPTQAFTLYLSICNYDSGWIEAFPQTTLGRRSNPPGIDESDGFQLSARPTSFSINSTHPKRTLGGSGGVVPRVYQMQAPDMGSVGRWNHEPCLRVGGFINYPVANRTQLLLTDRHRLETQSLPGVSSWCNGCRKNVVSVRKSWRALKTAA